MAVAMIAAVSALLVLVGLVSGVGPFRCLSWFSLFPLATTMTVLAFVLVTAKLVQLCLHGVRRRARVKLRTPRVEARQRFRRGEARRRTCRRRLQDRCRRRRLGRCPREPTSRRSGSGIRPRGCVRNSLCRCPWLPLASRHSPASPQNGDASSSFAHCESQFHGRADATCALATCGATEPAISRATTGGPGRTVTPITAPTAWRCNARQLGEELWKGHCQRHHHGLRQAVKFEFGS